MPEFICEHQQHLKQKGKEAELTLFLTELAQSVKSVGLKGSRFVIITYDFLGSVIA